MIRTRRDPFWDLDGTEARQTRARHKLTASLAFAMAVVACGLSMAAWLQTLGPALSRIHLG